MKHLGGSLAVALPAALALLGFTTAEVGAASSMPWMTCSPIRVEADAMLVLRKSPSPHRELGVWTPANEFFFLYSCDETLRAESMRSVACDSFAQARTLRLTVSSLLAPSAQSGYKQVAPVFTQPGEYVFLLGQNLETENSNETAARCKVRYMPITK